MTAKLSPVDYNVNLSKPKRGCVPCKYAEGWFERKYEENSKSDTRACLNITSSQADTGVQSVGDVVSNKVPTRRETESMDDVNIL